MHRFVFALPPQTAEVENLRQVVRELSESRAGALVKAATLAESHVDLQRAAARASRVAHLSREVSRENLAAAGAAKAAAREAARGARAAADDAEQLGAAGRRAAAENARLRQKMSLLERSGALGEVAASASMREFRARASLLETY